MVDPEVLRDPTLGWSAKLVYSLLTTYCAKERSAYPSRSRIAAELGISVRSVDAGLREARERGLIEVERRMNSGGDWTSNKYHLRDLGRGFVGLRSLGGSAGAAPPSAGRAPGGAGGADEQDHSSRPQRHTSSTSGDEVASSGHRASSSTESEDQSQRPKLRILPVRDYDDRPSQEVPQLLVKAAVGATRKVGIELTEDAKTDIGRAVKERMEQGRHRRQLAEDLEVWLNDAANGQNIWAWMFGYARAS